MLSFWEQYEPSIESMMLSQDANELDRMEKEEILSYLPPIKGRSVLELGSGIGSVNLILFCFFLFDLTGFQKQILKFKEVH